MLLPQNKPKNQHPVNQLKEKSMILFTYKEL